MNEAIQALQNAARIRENQPLKRQSRQAQPRQSFASTLETVRLEFTNHAQNRINHREINLSREGMNRLSAAVEKAAQKGGRESLVLMDDLAFIVNVPERKVVTAINTSNGRENVFTAIDSVVLAER